MSIIKNLQSLSIYHQKFKILFIFEIKMLINFVFIFKKYNCNRLISKAYCRVGYYRSNSAVSDDGTVICMPGYTFGDGNNVSHRITCDNPPYWNWQTVPECFPVRNIFVKFHFT